MTDVFRGEAKSDAKDARVIAETARLRSDLVTLTATDDLVVELTRLTGHREDLMADWVRGINRLRDLLTGIFPALERAFDYSTRSALVLLTGYQTPNAIRAAGEDGIADFLREHGAWARGIPALAAGALAAAGSQTLQLPGETTTALIIARQAAHLLDLDREIKQTDKLIAGTFREHPTAAIIESIPGMGPLLGADFLVATGGRMTNFSSAGRLASYAGLVPVSKDSGRVTGNLRRPRRFNRRLRRVSFTAPTGPDSCASLLTDRGQSSDRSLGRNEDEVGTGAAP
jgi:transposase